MCLAIPARIVSIEEGFATVDMVGNTARADVTLVPGVKVGDYVIVHAGLAIQKYDEAEAKATLELLREMAQLTPGGAL
jgi:hydrogenase expression/formation protein HypC